MIPNSTRKVHEQNHVNQKMRNANTFLTITSLKQQVTIDILLKTYCQIKKQPT